MLLPESILHSQVFAVLAAFVAVNTVMYGALALGKLLPKVYVADWVQPRNSRSETRSIHPHRATSPMVPDESFTSVP
jgi:hypothetical protein